MSETSSMTKVLIGAGIAAATAAVVAYVFRSGSSKKPVKGSLTAEDVTKEQLIQILAEINVAHERMRTVTKELSAKILADNLTFEEAYKRVIEVQPEDPLDKYGLTMMDFDRLLEREQYDPQVRQTLTKLMSAPEASTLHSKKDLNVQQMLEVHRFILSDISSILKHVESLGGKYQGKIVMVAAQAMVGAHVEGRFGASGDDVEVATSKLSMALAGNAEFNNLNLQIQQAMTELMAVCEAD